MAGAGVLLVAVSVVILANPHGFRSARGLYFALVLGLVLLCAAVLPT
jgi:hypothetical protein